MDDRQPGAVVVLGALFGARYPNLVPAASARRLTVLGIEETSPNRKMIEAARRANPEHPLASIGDVVWTSRGRHEEILEQVIEWRSHHRIRAAIALTEGFVESAALVTDYLGLPSPGLRASWVCRHKLLQRRYLAEWSPRSILVTRDRRRGAVDAWDEYPAVVKPTGREASSGVRRVNGRRELIAALDQYEADERVLLERLVLGHEVSVETLVQSGCTIFASVTGKRTNESSGLSFVEMGHTVPDPSLDHRTRVAVLRANEAILGRLRFRDGIAHAEYRIGADGRIHLMEIAARPPGDSIVTLYHLATGRPLEDAILAVALGEPTSYPPPHRYARQVYLEHNQGVLEEVAVDGLDAQVTWLPESWTWPAVQPRADGSAALHMVVIGRRRGDKLQEIRESGDRSLMYVIDAATPAELDTLEVRCTTVISVVVRGT